MIKIYEDSDEDAPDIWDYELVELRDGEYFNGVKGYEPKGRLIGELESWADFRIRDVKAPGIWAVFNGWAIPFAPIPGRSRALKGEV